MFPGFVLVFDVQFQCFSGFDQIDELDSEVHDNYFYRNKVLVYEPIHIRDDRLYIYLAQSRFSDLAQFNICCRGRSAKNFGASRFKKY